MCWMLKPFWGEQASSCGSIWSAYWRRHTDPSSDLWSDSPRMMQRPEDRPSCHRILARVASPTSARRVLNNELLLLEKLGSDMEGALSPQCCPPVVILRCCRCIEGARWLCQPSQSLLPLVGFNSPLAGQGRVMHSAEMWHDIHSMF